MIWKIVFRWLNSEFLLQYKLKNLANHVTLNDIENDWARAIFMTMIWSDLMNESNVRTRLRSDCHGNEWIAR